MFRRLAALGTAAAFLIASNAFAAAPAPRVTVGKIAGAIEENYFDSAKGKAIAADLRKAAARGEFDGLKDPHALAQALTRRLSPLDRHFEVKHRDDSAATPPLAGGPAQIPPETLERRTNYGLRKVEMLPGAIGYLDLSAHTDFDYGDPEDPRWKAVQAALLLLSNADAVIIDLRDNLGGSPAMAGYLVSAFVAEDADVYNTFHGAGGRSQSEKPPVLYPAPRPDVPLFVLTSRSTGSAAEASAYTLQAAKRAIVIGETTVGAANPGDAVPVGDGFSVFVSLASPINPITRGNWEGTGVKPDLAIPAADALVRAQILALEAIARKSPETTENRWVREALEARENPPAGISGLDALAGAYGAATVKQEGATLAFERPGKTRAILLPLGDLTFVDRADPLRRVVFKQDAAGKVTSLEVRLSSGEVFPYAR